MGRPGYRSHDKQCIVWVSLAMHGNIKRLAAEAGQSMQEWMATAFETAIGQQSGSATLPLESVLVGADEPQLFEEPEYAGHVRIDRTPPAGAYDDPWAS